MQSNLYTFGCSLAKYTWPMWPDILAQCFDKTENYGNPGCGNFYIFHQAIYCFSAKNISKDDTVIIQWTEPNRLDYIKTLDWENEGSNSVHLLAKSKLDFMVNDETSSIKTLTYMYILIEILKKIGCKWYFIFMSPESMVHKEKLSNLNLSSNVKHRYNHFQEYINLHKESIIDKKSMTEFFKEINMPINKSAWKVHNKLMIHEDDHPIPKFMFRYINEVLNPVLKLDIKSSEIFVNTCSELFVERRVINTEEILKKLKRMYSMNNFKIPTEER